MLDDTLAALNTKIEKSTVKVRTGINVPFYGIAGTDKLVAAKLQYPRVPVMATVNPNSGPGTAPDSRFVTAIPKLQDAGIIVKMYVPTNYAQQNAGRTVTDICNMIEIAYSLYPTIDGIMLDEMNGQSVARPFYSRVATFANTKNCHVLEGNPGTQVSVSYPTIFDVLDIYEGKDLPTLDQLITRTWATWGLYDKRKFCATVYGQAALSQSFVDMASRVLGWLYVTDATTPNPYGVLPTYLLDLFKALDATYVA